MEKFVVFITNHWILAALMALLLIAFFVNEWMHRRLVGGSSVSPEQAVQLMNHTSAVVFDVRSESLFSAGHVLGAEWVSLQSLDKKMGTLQKYSNKPVIVISATDHEASTMVTKLKEKGFSEVILLRGGMQAWKAAGLPVAKA